MKNVRKIIELLGGLDKFEHVRLESKGYMPLCIERIGEGPRGLPLISVAHYGEQNGDLMRDPDIEFEIVTKNTDGSPALTWKFLPVSIRNDYVGSHTELCFQNESGDVLVRKSMIADVSEFARMWDRNIAAQGFVDAAKRIVSESNAIPR